LPIVPACFPVCAVMRLALGQGSGIEHPGCAVMMRIKVISGEVSSWGMFRA